MNSKEKYNPLERIGESLERELLGIVKNVEDIEEERKRVEERAEKENIPEFEAAMEEVKSRQTENPINPRSPFANHVRSKTVDILQLKDEAVKFYTAISGTKNKTMLDRDFGIDAFLEFDEEDKKFNVTLDLTNNISKASAKAGIVEYIPDDFPIQARFEKGMIVGLTDEEFKVFDKYTDDLAEKIAAKFKNLISKEK